MKEVTVGRRFISPNSKVEDQQGEKTTPKSQIKQDMINTKRKTTFIFFNMASCQLLFINNGQNHIKLNKNIILIKKVQSSTTSAIKLRVT